jgi:small-conductance mechanosensitive channel
MEQLSTIQQINSTIMFGNLTNVELSSIIDAVKFARAQITKQQARALRVGDTVKFTSNRNGVTYKGTVDKIKIKYVLVNTPQGRYNVPASMLEAV